MGESMTPQVRAVVTTKDAPIALIVKRHQGVEATHMFLLVPLHLKISQAGL